MLNNLFYTYGEILGKSYMGGEGESRSQLHERRFSVLTSNNLLVKFGVGPRTLTNPPPRQYIPMLNNLFIPMVRYLESLTWVVTILDTPKHRKHSCNIPARNSFYC
jgi:hypothetical protein